MFIIWQDYPKTGLGILLWRLDFCSLPPDHNVVIFLTVPARWYPCHRLFYHQKNGVRLHKALFDSLGVGVLRIYTFLKVRAHHSPHDELRWV